MDHRSTLQHVYPSLGGDVSLIRSIRVSRQRLPLISEVLATYYEFRHCQWMPRYFFHIRDDEHLIVDEEGLEFQDAEEALLEAHASARDLVHDALLSGDAVAGQAIEVTDSNGNVIAQVDIAYSEKRPPRTGGIL